MVATPSIAALAGAREDAAADLDVAIAALKVSFARYERTTARLGERLNQQLHWQLEIPIQLHLVNAGLVRFLERKLQINGSLIPLRQVLEQHHRKLSIESPRA